ncbi:MAG: CaiB/BaiF CoA transferase family protein [Acidobacteriota bacterium]
MTSPSSNQPLQGVKVIDLTQVMLGPCATQMLGDYGADVIKIERPGNGDLSRWSLPDDPGGLDNPVFCSLNRNKRSIALNLKEERAREVVRELVKGADVIVNNFRPGVIERMGLGYERLRSINPRIIFAFGTGFGLEGPYAHKGGQDVLAQAMTGVMARKADPEHPLAIYATALADYSAAMHLVQGILLALLHRERTGEGQMVDVSLYDSMLAMQMQEAAMWMMRQQPLNWALMPLTGVFETKDGSVVLVGAFKENPLRDVCRALSIVDLSREERLSTMEGMKAHRAELQNIFRERFRQETTAYWIEALEKQDLLCAPVRSLPEALEDTQTAVNKMVVHIPHRGVGELRLVGSPIHLSGVPFAVRQAPPILGEHSEEILSELGYDSDKIAVLREDGVIA